MFWQWGCFANQSLHNCTTRHISEEWLCIKQWAPVHLSVYKAPLACLLYLFHLREKVDNLQIFNLFLLLGLAFSFFIWRFTAFFSSAFLWPASLLWRSICRFTGCNWAWAFIEIILLNLLCSTDIKGFSLYNTGSSGCITVELGCLRLVSLRHSLQLEPTTLTIVSCFSFGFSFSFCFCFILWKLNFDKILILE